MDVSRVLGGLLLGSRLAADLSIDEAAARSGLSADRIAQLEVGRYDVPFFSELLPLLRAYHVSLGLFAAAFDVASSAQAGLSPAG